MNMLTMFMLILITTSMLMIINLVLSKKSFHDREKSSPYECGFDPFNSTSESFSIQFFLISIMFLTFDIEIVLMIPMIPSMSQLNINWLITSTIILLTLLVGYYMEWLESSISWEK